MYVDEGGQPEPDAIPRQGPKQRPGPNDEQSLPPLVTASDLLDGSDDALAAIPSEPPDDETPPAGPTFIVVRNAYGPGAHSVKFADGKPVGVFINEQDMTGDQVRAYLTELGLDADLVDFFARNRDKARIAAAEIAAHPAVAAFAQEEDRRLVAKREIQAAFVKAQKKERT